MFDESQEKKHYKFIAFYVIMAAISLIVLINLFIDFAAKLNEADRCGYTACSEVLVNKDPEKARLLNCMCQCDSIQTLTSECLNSYECTKRNSCWKLGNK